MDTPAPPAVFAGDLNDPWVAAIAAALPAGTIRLACSESLPASWPSGAERAPVLVLHRAVLTNLDADRLAQARQGGWTPKIVLCIGPHARYHQVQHWATSLVDEIIPEAVAADVIGRHAGAPPRRRECNRTDIAPSLLVVSDQFETRDVLIAIGQQAGYAVRGVKSWSEAPPGSLVIWDVPVLESSWSTELAARAEGRRLLAWLSLADREMVSTARRAGAAACLDAGCGPADLVYVLDRLVAARFEVGHTLPPVPAHTRRRGVVAEPDVRS